MNRSLETVIESLLPALYNLQGSPEATEIAHQAAESLLSLIDTGALRNTNDAGSVADFLNATTLDPDLMEHDPAIAKVLIAATDAHTGQSKLSYAQIAQGTGMAVGAVRGSVSRLRQQGYFNISYPTQKEIDEGDHCLRYTPDMRTRINL